MRIATRRRCARLVFIKLIAVDATFGDFTAKVAEKLGAGSGRRQRAKSLSTQ
ncbi:MAG: hypothetical protein WDO56_00425 [Gammaproteobacteria bacterium]